MYKNVYMYRKGTAGFMHSGYDILSMILPDINVFEEYIKS